VREDIEQSREDDERRHQGRYRNKVNNVVAWAAQHSADLRHFVLNRGTQVPPGFENHGFTFPE